MLNGVFVGKRRHLFLTVSVIYNVRLEDILAEYVFDQPLFVRAKLSAADEHRIVNATLAIVPINLRTIDNI